VADSPRQFDVSNWSDTINYLSGRTTVPELDALLCDVSGLLATDGVLCLANVVDTNEPPEWELNTPTVLAAYRVMLEGRLRMVYDAEFTDEKDDSQLTYYLWGFRRPG
jgi:hypothetical protein